MTTIQLGDITFSGGPVSIDGWRFTKLEGWDDLPESKGALEERAQEHGAFDPGDDLRESAKPSFEGWFEGKDRASALAAKRLLKAQAPRRGRQTMTVTDEEGPLRRSVSVRFIDIPDDHGRTDFSFSVDMVAPDPFAYGPWVAETTGIPTQSTGLSWPLGTARPDATAGADVPFWDWGTDGNTGRASAVNHGNGDTYSELEVTGGLSGGFLLTWVPTGDEIRFERQILDGSVVTLNPRTGRATIDDQSDVSGYLTRANWWPVEAGESGQVQFTPLGTVTGTPTLTVRTASAFL